MRTGPQSVTDQSPGLPREPLHQPVPVLQGVLGIEIETREVRGGQVKVIASREDPAVIGKILGYLGARELPAGPSARGPPQGE